jgi:hypothetical protein
MMERSSGKKCCCMNDGFCRKLTTESDCIRQGGKVVEDCSDCK